MAQAIEHLPSRCKALSSNSSTIKKKPKMLRRSTQYKNISSRTRTRTCLFDCVFFYDLNNNTMNYSKGLETRDLTVSFYPYPMLSLWCLTSEPCMLPLDKGICQEDLSRWYFDFEQYQCKPFIYGGCQGNANNFFSKDDCRDACLLIGKTQIPISLRTLFTRNSTTVWL
jgi:hypothetical protein